MRRQLPHEDVWKLFGEGKHPNARQLYESKLAPFLTQASGAFWSNRLWYFDKGLYYQGGQVGVPYPGGHEQQSHMLTGIQDLYALTTPVITLPFSCREVWFTMCKQLQTA